MGAKKNIRQKIFFFRNLKINRYGILLLILSVVFLASVVRYGLRSFAYPVWDEQHYMYIASSYYRLLHHLSADTLSEMLQIAPFRQPGYPLFILPFLMIFGLANSYFWGIFTNGLFYIASIVGIYFISRNYLSRLASFFSAFIFAFYGWTLYYVHFTYSETATSAFCVVAVLFLIKSDYFQNRKQTLLFGLFMGLGILTKWVAFIFLLGPLIYVFYGIFKKKLFKRIIINVILALVIVGILTFPYFANFYWVFDYFKAGRFGGPMWEIIPEYERNPLTAYSLTYYLNSFQQLGIFYFILFFVGLVFAFKRMSKLKIILSAIIVPWLFFSFFSILKADRLIIPIYPYLAIVSASVFDILKNIKYKTMLAALIVILSIGTFLGTVWGRGPMKNDRYFISVKLPFNKSVNIYLTSISRPPYIYKISGKEILDFIAEDSSKTGIKDPQVLALFYYRPLDEPLMTYNLYSYDKPLAFNDYLGTILNNPDEEASILLANLFKNSDYILTKSGQRTDTYFLPVNYRTLRALINLFNKYVNIEDNFVLKTKIWINQDSSEISVFRKKSTITNSELNRLSLILVKLLKEQK